MNEKQDAVSAEKVKALEIALKLFEIYIPRATDLAKVDYVTHHLLETAKTVEKFIKNP
jgi:hypothetical protein